MKKVSLGVVSYVYMTHIYIYIVVGGITTEHLCVLRRRILDLLFWTVISPRVFMKSNFWPTNILILRQEFHCN